MRYPKCWGTIFAPRPSQRRNAVRPETVNSAVRPWEIRVLLETEWGGVEGLLRHYTAIFTTIPFKKSHFTFKFFTTDWHLSPQAVGLTVTSPWLPSNYPHPPPILPLVTGRPLCPLSVSPIHIFTSRPRTTGIYSLENSMGFQKIISLSS